MRIDLHNMKSAYQEAVGSALECLRLFGVEMPEHPTWEQVHDEYEKVWLNLGARSIESLIDLPPMTDPEIQAATRVLSGLRVAFFTDKNLFLLSTCLIVNLSLKYGTIEASAHGYATFGNILGRAFHRYADAYRFAKLGVDLAEKHGFAAYKAKVYMNMAWVAIWTKPVTTALDFVRAAFSAAVQVNGRRLSSPVAAATTPVFPREEITLTRCGASPRSAWISSGKPSLVTIWTV